MDEVSINRDMLKTYAKIWDEYKKNPGFVFSNENRNIITIINNMAENDEKLMALLEQLRSSNDPDLVIEEYFNNLQQVNKGSENESKIIAETFGIDISKIEHKYLKSGNEVFSFFDTSLGRQVVLENKKDGVSLVEQLKEIQVQNKNYQTSNDSLNTQNMLEDKALKENCELSMVPIEEVWEHLNQVQCLTIEDYRMLNFLIANAASLKISYINIENLVGIDKDGKIYEVYKDSSLRYQIGEPNSASYNEEKINVSDRVDDNYTVSEQNVNLQSSYEDVPNEIEKAPDSTDLSFDDLPEDIQQKVVMFYEYPEMLNSLSLEDREIWQSYIALYNEKIELEQEQLKNNNPKVKRYVMEKNDNYGYINLANLSLIITFVIFTLIFVLTVFK